MNFIAPYVRYLISPWEIWQAEFDAWMELSTAWLNYLQIMDWPWPPNLP
jgi:hypothetical protein